MPFYIYKATSSKGRTLKGEMEAPRLDLVEKALRHKGYSKVKVKERPKDIFQGTFLEGKVQAHDMVIFSRQFSTMISAGVPILQALQIMVQQTENQRMKRILADVRNAIESGSTLYDAMRRYPDAFDVLYVNMVNAGEMGGILDVILQRLAEYIEKAAKLKAKVKGAMTYPTIVLFIAVLVVTVILLFVIPTFAKMFAEFGSALPAPTQIVVNMSEFVQSSWYILLAGIIAFFVGLKYFRKWDKGEQIWDRFILFTPVFGPLLRKVAVARFARTLSTMVTSGVPILNALDIVAKTAGNRTVQDGVLEARKSISEGQSLADPLEETGVFPSMVTHMISIGESTGALDTMLSKIADFYDSEVDQAVENLTSMIEPIMIVFLGVVVGGMVVAMYLPIFSIAGAIG